MFAYCLNNPVNGCDPCGTCLHRLDFWNDCEKCGGKNVRDKWRNFTTWCMDAYDKINSVNQQQMMVKNEVTRHQNQIVSDVVDTMWDTYVHSNELEAQTQYEQDMSVKSFWEDTVRSPARTGDFVGMTAGNVSTYCTYVSFAAAPTISGAALLVIGIGVSLWTTLRYYNIIIE